MAANRLANYLKTYRKKTGLSQREVAFLLGLKSGEQVSRYEKRHQLPSFGIALACAAVFNTPITELFAGAHDVIDREIQPRLATLRTDLEKKGRQGKEGRLPTRKLAWLSRHHGRAFASTT